MGTGSDARVCGEVGSKYRNDMGCGGASEGKKCVDGGAGVIGEDIVSAEEITCPFGTPLD